MIEQKSFTHKIQEPILEPPGAGLPFWEWFIAKYVILPQKLRNTSKRQAIEMFKSEGQKIIALADRLNEDQLSKRILVPRLTGLEDSSRFWSVAMTLEHLIIVNERIQIAIEHLSANDNALPTIGTADVKPDINVDAKTVIARFETMFQSLENSVQSRTLSQYRDCKYPHPWFGPLNAEEWLVTVGLHCYIHRVQINHIVKSI
jgi:hypothetical protein